jgi:hypothetical protein
MDIPIHGEDITLQPKGFQGSIAATTHSTYV